MSKEVVIINQTYTGMSSDVNPVILEWDTLPKGVKENVLEAAGYKNLAVELYEYNWDGEHDLSGHLQPLLDNETGKYKGQVSLGEPVIIKHIVEFCYSE